MATYKQIKGTQIEVVASDPSNPVEGQVWFNTTSNVLKGAKTTTAGSWATGGTTNTGNLRFAGFGSQGAAVKAGGIVSPKAENQIHFLSFIIVLLFKRHCINPTPAPIPVPVKN